MEARINEKKLTRHERLKKCDVPDEQIPAEFIDNMLSRTIMDLPAMLDGNIMDFSYVQGWQQYRLAGLLRIQPSLTVKEIYAVCVVNPFTMVPCKSFLLMEELNKKIETWVQSQEQVFRAIKESREKEQQLRQLTENLNKAQEKLDKVLTLENGLTEEQRQCEVESILTQMDQLARSKGKLEHGNGYYELPGVLQKEIARLQTKKKMAELVDEEIKELYFSENDQKELDYCIKLANPGILPPPKYPKSALQECAFFANSNEQTSIPSELTLGKMGKK